LKKREYLLIAVDPAKEMRSFADIYHHWSSAVWQEFMGSISNLHLENSRAVASLLGAARANADPVSLL